MPRYFFHVDNGEFIPDETGTELPDLYAARREAVRSAGEMIDDVQELVLETHDVLEHARHGRRKAALVHTSVRSQGTVRRGFVHSSRRH